MDTLVAFMAIELFQYHFESNVNKASQCRVVQHQDTVFLLLFITILI